MNEENSMDIEDQSEIKENSINEVSRKFSWWRVAAVLLAIVSGVFAFIGTQRYLSANATEMEQRLSDRLRNVEVIVAAKALQAGQVLMETDLAKRGLPEIMTTANSLRPADLEEVLGRQLLVAMATGEPISRAALAQQEVRSLAARLQPGARAVTVPVDDVTSQANLVRPGDRVDLMVAEERSELGVRCVEVTPLIDAITVLATGQSQEQARSGADELRRAEDTRFRHYSTLTLDVTPAQAQQISAALRLGELIPVLRSEGDLAASNLPVLSAGLPACSQPILAPSAAKPAPQNTTKVELWVGGQVPPRHSVHEFAADGRVLGRSASESEGSL